MNRANRRLNVLVLGVGGNVSQSIQKALALTAIPTRVIAACISADAPGLYVAERAYISPLARDPEFAPWLASVCEHESVDAVLSGSEIVLEELAEHAAAIREQTGAVCIVSSREVLRIGRDKLLTCQWLEEHGLPVPAYADPADPAAVDELVARCGFPLIAKPRLGKGSDGILTIRDQEDLGRAVAVEDITLRETVRHEVTPSDLVLQQYLGDEDSEFTVGCFCSADGSSAGTVAMRRRLQHGTTTFAEPGAYREIEDVATRIASALRPLGPCNIQLRVHRGAPIPFEINTRFSGTTALRAQMGFNEVEAALRHYVLGEPPPILRAREQRVALRYWNEVYVDAAAVDAMRREHRVDDPHAFDVQIERWGSQ